MNYDYIDVDLVGATWASENDLVLIFRLDVEFVEVAARFVGVRNCDEVESHLARMVDGPPATLAGIFVDERGTFDVAGMRIVADQLLD